MKNSDFPNKSTLPQTPDSANPQLPIPIPAAASGDGTATPPAGIPQIIDIASWHTNHAVGTNADANGGVPVELVPSPLATKVDPPISADDIHMMASSAPESDSAPAAVIVCHESHAKKEGNFFPLEFKK